MTKASQPILPGSTVGVLGSGQLGRMFAIAARRMGYRVHTYSPHYDTPTGQVSDREVHGEYDDLDAVRKFAADVDVVTFEFENVSSDATTAAAEVAPVRPAGNVLHTTQHRLREKTFLRQHGFAVTPFHAVRNETELREAAQQLGLPGILKTAGFGYDGKGQSRIETIDQGLQVLAKTPAEMIYEQLIEFDREVSVVTARGLDGSFAHWGVIENTHRHHILDVSVSPADVAETLAREAVEISRGVVEALDVVGVLCVEFFLTRDGRLLINELAPRPHNSGHLTFDANLTSQFEQQLRAVCGLPLGATTLLRPAAMVNLLGDLWSNGEPNWQAACGFENIKLHLYGKHEAKPGRKMGHLTALSNSPEEAKRMALAAREALLNR